MFLNALSARPWSDPQKAGTPPPCLILGCKPGPALQRRLQAAIALYRQNASARLVISGRGEAQIAAQWALIAGIPESAVTIEPRAQNTRQNLEYSAPILGKDPFWLVTDPIHMKRALFFARRFHLCAWPFACAPDPKGFERFKDHLRELFAAIQRIPLDRPGRSSSDRA